MSRAGTNIGESYDQDLDEFLEERREVLEMIVEEDMDFKPYAKRLLDYIDDGGDA